MAGKRVVLLPTEGELDALGKLLESDESYSLTKLTPTHLDILSQLVTKSDNIGRFVIGGEALLGSHLTFWQQNAPQTRFVNEYGPTETVVGCCVYEADASEQFAGAVPIGRPIANTQLYIVDPEGNPVPIGVAGELYIGGSGVGRGYLNRPDLTAERFIDNPFSNGKLYKTGDLCRYLADGNIDYLGRIDQQVKIRGFRIELGEVEEVIKQHPAIEQAIVRPYDGPNQSNKQLAAYVVPKTADDTILQKQLDQWQAISDDAYQSKSGLETAVVADLAFDLSGWLSSYTDGLIPEQEMAEWVDVTVAEIMTLEPQHVLEIGCGTGLLLARIAPHVASYWGVDHAAASIAQIEQLKQQKGWGHVTASQQRADNLTDLPEQQFDTIIINSVIQYFPTLHYLQTVLDQALHLLKPGGQLFVGDVRSLPHLAAYHASVQLYRADDDIRRTELQTRIAQRLQQEEELVIDPHFFNQLQADRTDVAAVNIHVKRGQAHNELTRFRYQVVVEKTEPSKTDQLHELPELQWADWSADGLTPAALEARLNSESPIGLAITNIPDARLADEVRLLNWLDESHEDTVGQWRTQGDGVTPTIDPESLWALGEAAGYKVDIRWGEANHGSLLTALFKRNPALTLPATTKKRQSPLANNPLLGKLYQTILPSLRTHLQTHLPDYMLPAAYMLLDTMPMTHNGKVNDRALPAPIFRANPTQITLPRTETERTLVAIWCDVLGLEQIGIHDNFFELGGHSLLATQVISRVKQQLGLSLPIRALFEHSTIASFADSIESTQTQEISAISVVNRDAPLPLSFAQQRLWFLDQLEGANPAYNMPVGMRVLGTLDSDALGHSINTLVARHEVFRTSFSHEAGVPAQIIRPTLHVPLLIEDWQTLSKNEQVERLTATLTVEAQTVFDLSVAPTFAVAGVALECNRACVDGHDAPYHFRRLVAGCFCAGVVGTLQCLHRKTAVPPPPSHDSICRFRPMATQLFAR